MMLADTLEIHFVELPKFLDEQPELNNSLNKWLAFLTKPEKEVMEVVEMGEPAIRKAITVLDMLSRDPETVRLAELQMKKILIVDFERIPIHKIHTKFHILEDETLYKLALMLLIKGWSISAVFFFMLIKKYFNFQLEYHSIFVPLGYLDNILKHHKNH